MSIWASSSRLMTPPGAAGCAQGIHATGSNLPRLITSSAGGTASPAGVSQPRPASARRWPIAENSASSGVSSQARSTSAPAAADRSRAAVWTVSVSGRYGGTTNRSRGRPIPAACRVRHTP